MIPLNEANDSIEEVNLSKFQNDGRLNELIEVAMQIGEGAIDVVALPTSKITVDDDLANYCLEPRCAFYNLSANCPPNVSGPSGMRQLLRICDFALAIKIDVPMGCLNTDERLIIMKLLHEIVADVEKAALKLGYLKSKAFAAGSCKEIFCNEYEACQVLSDGGECRNPEYARPTVESAGINVLELCKAAGWSLIDDTHEGDTNKVSMGAVYGLVVIG